MVRPRDAEKNERRLMIRFVVVASLHKWCGKLLMAMPLDFLRYCGSRLELLRLQLRCATRSQHNWLDLRNGAARRGSRR